jgi:hypothetical protein
VLKGGFGPDSPPVVPAGLLGQAVAWGDDEADLPQRPFDEIAFG